MAAGGHLRKSTSSRTAHASIVRAPAWIVACSVVAVVAGSPPTLVDSSSVGDTSLLDAAGASATCSCTTFSAFLAAAHHHVMHGSTGISQGQLKLVAEQYARVGQGARACCLRPPPWLPPCASSSSSSSSGISQSPLSPFLRPSLLSLAPCRP